MFGIPGKAGRHPDPRRRAPDRAADGDARARQGLRIGVKKGGCAGMEYTMDYVTEVNPHGRGGGTGRRAGDDRADGADVPDRHRDRL